MAKGFVKGFAIGSNSGKGFVKGFAITDSGAIVVSAVVTGTLVPTVEETDIVAGGDTLIITLTNDTWVAAGATFEAQRQNIIDGLDAAASPTNGWNNEVRDNEVVTAVVRTSATVVTITLSAAAGYNIAATETITTTIPATALVTSSSAVIATPVFTVTSAGSVVPILLNQFRRRR